MSARSLLHLLLLLCLPACPVLRAAPLSPQPSDEEVFETKSLPEPLVAFGLERAEAGNQSLAEMLSRFELRERNDDFSAIEKYLAEKPASRWRVALLTNLGLLQYRAGYFSRCLETYKAAWESGRDATETKGKLLADRAGGEYAKMLARLGRYAELKAFLAGVESRRFQGQATELIAAARGGIALMETNPEMAFRCGPMALSRILFAQNSPLRASSAIAESKSTMQGMSLSEVAALSRQVGLSFQAAQRKPGAQLIFPSVIHWKAGHYAALIKEEGGLYLTDDPTFENETWHTPTALETEASGYFLIPAGPLPAGWTALSDADARQIYGKGATSGNNPDDTKDDDQKDGGDENNCKGMASWSFHTMLVSLHIADTPAGYTSPYGPSANVRVSYNQREAAQPSNFNYSNFGPKWTFNWLSYITDSPSSPASATVAAGGGGVLRFTGYVAATQSFAPQYDRQSTLKRVSEKPLRYELANPDGSRDVYGLSDGSTVAPRKVFLTQRVDPAGNSVTLTYDTKLRITRLTDAAGLVTTLAYGLASDPYKITKITDPFGRHADFTYAQGQLVKIRDVIGLESAFTYATGGDFIQTLTTPYGATQFTYAESGRTRRLTATNPQGDTEVLEYNENPNLRPSSDPADKLPAGLTLRNSVLYARNSYYWDKKAWREYPEDYSRARLYHWLHTENYTLAGSVLESYKMPFENRVWFNYAGQAGGNEGATLPGTMDKPTKIGRRLDNGRTELRQATYNANGLPTLQVDEVGRRTVLTYASNGIDLQTVQQQTAGGLVTLAAYTWNSGHRPLTYTDAAGQVTTYRWNPQGQILSATNARNETTTFTYYAASVTGKQRKGRLQTVNGALPGNTDVVTFDYDNAGNTASVTGPDGYKLLFTFDGLDRLTRVTFPDKTYTETVFDRLDPKTSRDRLGRVTSYAYNSIRQLESVTDPLSRTIGYRWCKCGGLSQLIDALGRITSWKHDVQGRVTAKIYTDGSTVKYAYAQDNGLLLSTTDEKAQVKTRTYNLDQTLASLLYTNAEHTTPNVAFTYDSEFRRLQTMVDGIGTTTYAYHPIAAGTLGAGQLAAVDGPLTDDTLTYTYDQLARNTGYAINGVGETRTFDPLGRLLTAVNPLGTFGYTYAGATGRMDKVTYPNGMTCQYNYHPLAGDFRLKDIIHTLPGNTSLSRHSYEYNVVGNIIRWTQISPQANLRRSWLCGYDAADQLTSVTSQDPDTLATLPVGQYGYTYDFAGNRLTETIDGVTTTASFNALNQLATLTSAGASTLPQQTYEWDAENQLIAINYVGTDRRSEFKYDGDGLLARFVEMEGAATAAEHRLVRGDFDVAEQRDGSGTAVERRYFESGIQVAHSGQSMESRMFGRDLLGSVRSSSASDGRVVDIFDFTPWGGLTQLVGQSDDITLGISGHWRHSPSSLVLAPFRVFNSQSGRWMSRDPGAEGELSLDGPNLYGYVGNNPLNLWDPLGFDGEHTKGKRPSTEEKHQKGRSRKRKDQGGEKGDDRRPYPPRKRPDGWKGPWPPKEPLNFCPLPANSPFLESAPVVVPIIEPVPIFEPPPVMEPVPIMRLPFFEPIFVP